MKRSRKIVRGRRPAKPGSTRVVPRGPSQARALEILERVVNQALAKRAGTIGFPPIPEPVRPPVRRTPTGCPRCGGYVYRGSVPHSGSLTSSNCANCGWQGDYQGLPADEEGMVRASKRVFDYEATAEAVRKALVLSKSLAKAARTRKMTANTKAKREG